MGARNKEARRDSAVRVKWVKGLFLTEGGMGAFDVNRRVTLTAERVAFLVTGSHTGFHGRLVQLNSAVFLNQVH